MQKRGAGHGFFSDCRDRGQGALSRDRVLVGLLIALFLLRFVPVGLHVFCGLSRDMLQIGPIASYAIFLALIHHERRRVTTFHIDRVAILLILALVPIQLLIQEGSSFWPVGQIGTVVINGTVGAAFVTFIVLFVRFRSEYGWGTFRWSSLLLPVAGLGLGVLLAAANAFPLSFQVAHRDGNVGLETLISADILRQTVLLLGSAAAYEEPLFRGFLWGFLILRGWSPTKVLVVQAVLFSAAHFYYYPDSLYSLLLVVPVSALCFGWMVMKSRSLAVPLVAHGVFDGLAYTMGRIVAGWRG